MCFGRTRGPKTRFGVLGWGARCVRDLAETQSGARRRSFGKRQESGARRFKPIAAMTRRVTSAPPSAAGRRSVAGSPRTTAVEPPSRQARASWNVTHVGVKSSEPPPGRTGRGGRSFFSPKPPSGDRGGYPPQQWKSLRTTVNVYVDPSNACTGSSSAGSRPNAPCPTRRPRPCCSGP